MLGVRLFGLLPYLLPCIGALYALVAIALARRGSPRAVYGVWILGPLVLTIALAGWVAFMLTPGIIPFHRWLRSFALVLAAPTAAAGLAATLLAATRMARRWLALHVLATLAVFAIVFWLRAVASMHVVELIETIQWPAAAGAYSFGLAPHSYLTGTSAGAPFFFTSIARVLAGWVLLAFRPTMWMSSGPSKGDSMGSDTSGLDLLATVCLTMTETDPAIGGDFVRSGRLRR